jgi:DnaJ-class molecular chaperone
MNNSVELELVCDECGGSGELPSATCRLCSGTGTIRRVVTLEEFREVREQLD